jgi:hypothetical protein
MPNPYAAEDRLSWLDRQPAEISRSGAPESPFCRIVIPEVRASEHQIGLDSEPWRQPRIVRFPRDGWGGRVPSFRRQGRSTRIRRRRGRRHGHFRPAVPFLLFNGFAVVR